jgi:hypothetical protein
MSLRSITPRDREPMYKKRDFLMYDRFLAEFIGERPDSPISFPKRREAAPTRIPVETVREDA